MCTIRETNGMHGQVNSCERFPNTGDSLVFYSFQQRTILLVIGRPAIRKGLIFDASFHRHKFLSRGETSRQFS